MCQVSLLQSGQNKDYLANDEPLKVGDCVAVQNNNGKTEDSVILFIEQRTADAAADPCKAGKIIAKK